MNAEQAWQETLGRLQMDMDKASFNTWVRDTMLVSYQENEFTIGVQNAFARDWLENRLSSTIAQHLTGSLSSPQTVKFVVVHRDTPQSPAHPIEDAQPAQTVPVNPTINTRYKFETFVVGASNRLAHAACMAVAEHPAHAYNPLFLYGGVGLGKTHLLHAIGNVATQRGLSVMYVSSEEFTNDLIQSIRTQTTPAFRERYRSIDVLLIDDIQFIAGKESTQEEFFHTFNALHGQNKQIVLSSDRPPKAMLTLEDRLRSRFEWGLAADIQAPDYETRIAILRSKAERAGRKVPAEIFETIARQIQSNIRELEGALTRVMAFSDLSGQELTMNLVHVALADLIPQQKTIEPGSVVSAVASVFGISKESLLGRDRSREIALPRQVAMYLMREEANVSLPQIGEALGGRDHTTVMYACDKVAGMIEQDDRLRRKVFQVREQIYGVRSAVA